MAINTRPMNWAALLPSNGNKETIMRAYERAPT
jgi:hypothetical protein